ncbi:hypothetical protein AMJ82_12270 [candidate division TA06 bacterium SM23_40]|uniref:Uncharacterized protein n=1 Tax=candidate division TA06 bacterium SM23_40 TaxID=1703774 RepID=A0A0S8FZM0_UNCT6|nr:MAG: hypothetical protein AMJ82_12270 [candidate division TA06 bacterium SM23_40]
MTNLDISLLDEMEKVIRSHFEKAGLDVEFAISASGDSIFLPLALHSDDEDEEIQEEGTYGLTEFIQTLVRERRPLDGYRLEGSLAFPLIELRTAKDPIKIVVSKTRDFIGRWKDMIAE